MMTQFRNYAFIDSQNLNLAILDSGWKLDFKKFYIYLKDKYKVCEVFLFLGYIAENKSLYNFLRDIGYILIFKPILKTSSGRIKGNIDAELVLHTMIQYPNFEKALIVTGDGDFYCLIGYLISKNKLLKIGIPNKHKYSALLRKFANYHFYVNKLRNLLG